MHGSTSLSQSAAPGIWRSKIAIAFASVKLAYESLSLPVSAKTNPYGDHFLLDIAYKLLGREVSLSIKPFSHLGYFDRPARWPGHLDDDGAHDGPLREASRQPLNHRSSNFRPIGHEQRSRGVSFLGPHMPASLCR